MRAGQLNKRIVLQAPGPERGDPYSDPQPLWVDVATVWARIEPLSGREYFYAREQQSDLTVRITIRARADVKANWRIRRPDNSQSWEVASPPMNIESANDQMVLMCREVLNG